MTPGIDWYGLGRCPLCSGLKSPGILHFPIYQVTVWPKFKCLSYLISKLVLLLLLLLLLLTLLLLLLLSHNFLHPYQHLFVSIISAWKLNCYSVVDISMKRAFKIWFGKNEFCKGYKIKLKLYFFIFSKCWIFRPASTLNFSPSFMHKN